MLPGVFLREKARLHEGDVSPQPVEMTPQAGVVLLSGSF